MQWQALQDKMRRQDFCDLSEQYSFHPRAFPPEDGTMNVWKYLNVLLHHWSPSGGRRRYGEREEGEGKWTWPPPAGQPSPGINTCWLHLPVLPDSVLWMPIQLAIRVFTGSTLQSSCVCCVEWHIFPFL